MTGMNYDEEVPRNTTVNVAVYGTLKKGWRLHGILTEDPLFKYLGNSKLQGFDMYSVHGMYPAIVPSNDDNKTVDVEIYQISAERLKILDRVEGTPTLYRRWSWTRDAEKVYFYVFNNPVDELEPIEKWG